VTPLRPNIVILSLCLTAVLLYAIDQGSRDVALVLAGAVAGALSGLIDKG